ncbi:hypothetical protein EV561_10194 [Rhizobium sp. BK376]|nr:hypothetical protein EV561_10194 [Rhizobium sp. BK376]
MVALIEDWLQKLGFINAERLMARAALCAEDSETLKRNLK